MSKLLSDEEIREKVDIRFESVTAEGHQRSCSEYQTAVDDIMEIFNTQKRLYAEMVVGEYPKNAGRKNISDVMAEQRARIK